MSTVIDLSDTGGKAQPGTVPYQVASVATAETVTVQAPRPRTLKLQGTQDWLYKDPASGFTLLVKSGDTLPLKVFNKTLQFQIVRSSADGLVSVMVYE